jgi:serine/threonine-protein kinase
MPMPITSLAEGELDHAWPQILPGGTSVLFTSNNRIGAWDRASIDVASLTDGSRRTLVRGGTFGRYLGSGHLAYVNGGTLFAASFDAGALTLRGTPVPMVEDVVYSTSDGSAQIDASRSGVFIYRSGSSVDLTTLQWLDGSGAAQPLLTKPGDYSRPLFSPDGRRLALGLNGDLWVYEWQRDTLTRLTFEGGANYSVWSPDSQYLVFRSASTSGMHWVRSDGAGKTQALTQSATPQWPWSFTPDGRRLAFQERTGATGWDLWTAPMERDNGGLRLGEPEVFLQTTFDEQNPSFSPDGRWLAYSSTESGLHQVYVRAFPDTGGKWQVSSDSGRQPEWSRSSPELLFRSGDNQIMAVTYTVKGDSFLAERPRAWSSQRLAQLDRNGMYDLTPDATRIAAMMPADTPADRQGPHHVVFLENFFDELRRRVPVGP